MVSWGGCIQLKSYYIVNLMYETEKAMGLESVTESDRAEARSKSFTVTYEDLFENGELDVSRAQFYKTMCKAKELKLERIGSPRSATYQWIG